MNNPNPITKLLAVLVAALSLLFSAISIGAGTFPVSLQQATADNSQPGFTVDQAIDGILSSGNGWAVYYQVGQPHTAVFETQNDLLLASGGLLTFKVVQQHGGQHTLGRFRLSATTDPRSAFADGLLDGGDVVANWTVLTPIGFSSEAGATMTKLPDESILMSGLNPDSDRYTVTVNTSLSNITGFRIEALTDASLAGGGPGRQPNGNFVLSELQVEFESCETSAPPHVVTQPLTQSVYEGRGTSLTVAVAGSCPLAYQWQQNGSNLVGATNNSLLLNDLVSSHSGPYRVIITNSFGSVTSQVAVLTVLPAPHLSWSLSTHLLSEGASPATIQATLSRDADFTTAVTVFLTNSDLTEILIPASVTLPAGSNSVTFDVQVINDGEVDGTQAVSVTAGAPFYVGGSAALEVADDDSPTNRTLGGPLFGSLAQGEYRVLSDLVVPANQTLAIPADTILQFETNTSLNIVGTLIAEGNFTNMVVFTCIAHPPQPGSWRGIILNSTAATGTTSILDRVEISYAENGIAVNGTGPSLLLRDSLVSNSRSTGIACSSSYLSVSDVLILSSVIINNGVGISASGGASGCSSYSAGATIEDCEIGYNTEAGISLLGWGDGFLGCSRPRSGGGSALIRRSTIHHNGIGIRAGGYPGYRAYGYAIAYAENNLILSNSTAGLHLDGNVSGKIINNVIAYTDGSGIQQTLDFSDSVEIGNNIIVGNGDGVASASPLTNAVNAHAYNLVFGNMTNNWRNYPPEFGVLTTTNRNGTPSDSHLNLSLDPGFQGANDFRLQINSPAVNAGSPVSAPAADYFGSLRDFAPDLGVHEVVAFTQPEVVNALLGRSAAFGVQINVAGAISYQWQHDGVMISGANNPNFFIARTTVADAGSYRVVMTTSSGSVTSSVATLAVQTVVAWGNNSAGQTNVPVGLSGVTAIAAGGEHTVALKGNGMVVAWGNNSAGQATVPVAAQSGVARISAGINHTLALKSNGTLVAWGDNTYGETTVPISAQSGVSAISGGYNFTVVAKSNGTVVAWGYNDAGATNVPADLSGVVAVAAGIFHTVALKSDGSVVAWGYNGYGQTTVPLEAQSGVAAIAASYYHTVALKSNGLVIAWGGSTVPTDLNGVTAITEDGAAALKNDGTVIAWGGYAVPTDLNGVTAIAAEGGHTVAVIAAPFAPLITTQPVNKTVIAGQNASFNVMVTANATLSYQWYRNDSLIAGATNASYAAGTAQPGDAGTYRVHVSNSAGSVDSATASLVVQYTPVISGQPQSQTVTSGQTVTFSVAANGVPSLSYQWYRNNVPIAGATGTSFGLNSAQLADAGIYKVRISNSVGSVDSASAALVVQYLPVITSQPQGQAVLAGQAFSLNIAANGVPAPGYQWYRNDSLIAGATNASYAVASAQPGDAGTYRVHVSNSVGSVDSATASLVVQYIPIISGQPQSQTVTSGQTVTFSVAANGVPSLSYQWYRNNVPIAGATGTSFGLNSAQLADAGIYKVRISNSVGSVDSASAALVVQYLPVITSQPQGQAVLAGQAFSLNIAANGVPAPGYQWYRNDSLIAGATNASYAVASAQPGDAGTYRVHVSNSVGSVDSATASLVVQYAPVITEQPQSLVATTRQTISFSVAASGVPAPSFQWYFGKKKLAGQTNSILLRTNVQLRARGDYSVVVNNSLGSIRSEPARLRVVIPPTILSKPRAITSKLGQRVSLQVVASGSRPFTYQWLKDGSIITQATNRVFTIPHVQLSDAGLYSIRVSNIGAFHQIEKNQLTVIP